MTTILGYGIIIMMLVAVVVSVRQGVHPGMLVRMIRDEESEE